jgi:hypothetical protein
VQQIDDADDQEASSQKLSILGIIGEKLEFQKSAVALWPSWALFHL